MLMAVAQFKADVFSEINRICLFNYRICVIGKTIDELERIMKQQKGKGKAAAKMALSLVKAHKVRNIALDEIAGSVDDIILKISDKGSHIVATQDRELRRKLKEKGVPVMTLRQKKHLVFA